MYETPSKSKIASLKEVRGGLSPQKGMKLTYSPTFTEKKHITSILVTLDFLYE